MHNQTGAFAPPGAFARDVANRVRISLREKGEQRHADLAQWLRAALAAAAGLGAYAALLSGAARGGWAVGAIALAAFAAFLLIVQLGHDASHGAVSRRPWVNRAVLWSVFAVLGVDGLLWRDRHVRLHHAVPNLPGTGIDADSSFLLRLAPDKPWRPWHRWQPLYAPLVYGMGHASLVWLEDPAMLRAARAAGRHVSSRPSLVAAKLVHALLFLGLPWLALRPAPLDLLLGYLLASALVSGCFVVLVVGTHISDLAEFPSAAGAHDWATHQLVTSIDWAPASGLAVALSGGANAHVAHHLFPGHSHRHLAAISRIVADCAAAHGLRHRVTSFAGMVAGQWRHLVALSRPPAGALACPRSVASA